MKSKLATSLQQEFWSNLKTGKHGVRLKSFGTRVMETTEQGIKSGKLFKTMDTMTQHLPFVSSHWCCRGCHESLLLSIQNKARKNREVLEINIISDAMTDLIGVVTPGQFYGAVTTLLILKTDASKQKQSIQQLTRSL